MLKIVKLVLISGLLILLSIDLLSQSLSDSTKSSNGVEAALETGIQYYNPEYNDMFEEAGMKSGFGLGVNLVIGEKNFRYMVSIGFYSLKNSSGNPRSEYGLYCLDIGLGFRYHINYEDFYPYAGAGLAANIFTLVNRDKSLQHTARFREKTYIDIEALVGLGYKLSSAVSLDINFKEGFLLSEARFSKTIVNLGFSFIL